MHTPDDESSSHDPSSQILLQQAEQFFWHSQFSEALALLDQLDTHENVTELKRLQGQLLHCHIYAYLDVKKAHTITDQLIQMSQVLNQPLVGVDAQLVMAEAWLEMGMVENSQKLLDRGKAKLTSIPPSIDSDLLERKALVLALEGWISAIKGDSERAVVDIQQSLTLREQLGSPHGIAHALFYLGRAYMFQGNLDDAIECIQHSLILREQLDTPHEIAQSLSFLGRLYGNKGDITQGLAYTQKSLTIYERLGIPHGVAYSLSQCGVLYAWKGELTCAVMHFKKGLAICEHLGIPGTFAEARLLQNQTHVYLLTGELERALECLRQSYVMHETRGYKAQMAHNLSLTGRVYLQQGALDAAFAALDTNIQVFEEIGEDRGPIFVYSLILLILISLELKNPEAARQYLHRLDVLHTKGNKFTDQGITLARALLLKTSSRIRDKSQAQELFQQLTEDPIIMFDWTVLAFLNLCDLLFFEYKISDDPDILQELQTVTNRLLDLAHIQNAHSVLTETYLLQAKLALLELNVPQARQLFVTAQTIAKEKGLERLAQNISHEHDALLAQLPQWKALQIHPIAMDHIRKLSEVEEILSRLVQQRAPEMLDLKPEEPVILLILMGGGLPLFAYPFTKEIQLDEHLIGGFLTALAAFGQDALAASGAIDRITYHDYTVAVKPLASLLVCYIFQGPSYLALQKLDQFLTRIQETPSIYQALDLPTPLDASSKAISALGLTVQSDLIRLVTEIFSSPS